MFKNNKNQIFELLDTIFQGIKIFDTLSDELKRDIKKDILLSIEFIRKILNDNNIHNETIEEIKEIAKEFNQELLLSKIEKLDKEIALYETKFDTLFIVNDICEFREIYNLYIKTLKNDNVYILPLNDYDYFKENDFQNILLNYQNNSKINKVYTTVILDDEKMKMIYENSDIIVYLPTKNKTIFDNNFVTNNLNLKYIDKILISSKREIVNLRKYKNKLLYFKPICFEYVKKTEQKVFLDDLIEKARNTKHENESIPIDLREDKNEYVYFDINLDIFNQKSYKNCVDLIKLFENHKVVLSETVKKYEKFYFLIKDLENIKFVQIKDDDDYFKRAEIVITDDSLFLDKAIINSKKILFLGDEKIYDIYQSFLKNEKTFKKVNIRKYKQLKETINELIIPLDNNNGLYIDIYDFKNEDFNNYIEKFIDIETQIKRAVLNLNENRYESLKAFINVYNILEESELKKDFMNSINEFLIEYIDNDLYLKNIDLFKNYKFKYGFLDKNICDLNIRLYKFKDDIYFLYDVIKEQFIYEIKKDKYFNYDEVPYFFKNLENPLFINNNLEFFNFEYLNDNVRKSEYFGADNHIYMYYNKVDLFLTLFMLFDFKDVFKDQKFVFLFGRETIKRYNSIDYKKEYGIDYSITKCPLKLEELHRIMYLYMEERSGQVYFANILRKSDLIVDSGSYEFTSQTYLNSIRIKNADNQRFEQFFIDEYLKNEDRTYSIKTIEKAILNKNNTFCDVISNFLVFLKENNYNEEYSLQDITRLYGLFNFYKKYYKKETRFSPILLFEPHILEREAWENLLCKFKYPSALKMSRNPINVFAKAVKTNFIVMPYKLADNLSSYYKKFEFNEKILLNNIYECNFEMAKLDINRVLNAFCRTFNIPYTSKFLRAKSTHTTSFGLSVSDYSIKSIISKVDSIVTEFDMMRLKIFYEPILDYLGYRTFDTNGINLKKEDVLNLFKYEFKFENILKNPEYTYDLATVDNIRNDVYEILSSNYKKEVYLPKKMIEE